MLFKGFFRTVTNSPNRDIIRIVLDSIGILLGTNASVFAHNRPERVMNVCLLAISVLTSSLITGVLYNLMLGNWINAGPDTFEELKKLNIPIFISEEMNMIKDEWLPNIP